MKKFFVIAPVILASFIARADVIIEQKMESAVMNGNMTMKIKGDNARMDMPSPVGGNVTVIMNTKSGDMTTLMHAQKMAMKMNMNDAKKQIEASGIDPSKTEKPKATGVSEKVGEWTADVYEFNMSGMTGKIWAAKDFPNAKSIKDQMAKMSAASAGGFDVSKLDVPGMVVKTQMTTPVGAMTTTLVKASESPVEDSEFVIPTGYNEMKMPTFPGSTPK